MAKYKIIERFRGKERTVKSKGKVVYFRSKSAARNYILPKGTVLDFEKLFDLPKSRYKIRKVH